MNIIAAVVRNWGIGKEGQLLDHISEDMRFFKEKTSNKAVIMGKNTFLSLPCQKPLADRMNIVLTRDMHFEAEGVKVCHSIEEAIKEAEKKFEGDEIFFIGGEQVYNAATEFCDTAFITKIDNEYEADRYLKNFDCLEGWKIKNEEMLNTKKGIYITFTTYVKYSEKGQV